MLWKKINIPKSIGFYHLYIKNLQNHINKYKIYCKVCKVNPNTDVKVIPAEMHEETSRSAKVRRVFIRDILGRQLYEARRIERDG